MQSSLLPQLLSLNTLVKMGSVPSLGGLTDGSLIPGINSLQFPELDGNLVGISGPHGEQLALDKPMLNCLSYLCSARGRSSGRALETVTVSCRAFPFSQTMWYTEV